MKSERPVNLNLLAFHFPVTAITSILHRITGVILAIAIPFLLYVLELSLGSQTSFQKLKDCLTSPVGAFFAWVVVSALSFHLVAGIKHLIMDLGIGESLCGARLGAKLVLFISFILIIFTGVILW